MDSYFGMKISDFLERYEGRLRNYKTALDIGCANGAESIYLSGLGLNVTGIDIALPDNLPFAHNIRWLKEDIMNFDFQENNFNVIVAFNVLQFLDLKNRNKILKNIFRSLSPGGLIFIKSFTQKAPYSSQTEDMGPFQENELLDWGKQQNLHILEYQEKEIESSFSPVFAYSHGIVFFAAEKSREQ